MEKQLDELTAKALQKETEDAYKDDFDEDDDDCGKDEDKDSKIETLEATIAQFDKDFLK